MSSHVQIQAAPVIPGKPTVWGTPVLGSLHINLCNIGIGFEIPICRGLAHCGLNPLVFAMLSGHQAVFVDPENTKSIYCGCSNKMNAKHESLTATRTEVSGPFGHELDAI